MTESDRRVQRTRQRLRKALIELLGERVYDAITVQDIVDRANVARSTFYLHYSNKDELFLSCHEAIVSGFHSLHSLSRDELLSSETPPGMIAAYRHLDKERAVLNPIFQGQESPLILQRIRDRSAQQIEARLNDAFAASNSAIPLDVLAGYLAGAQLALAQWWLEKRRPHTAEELAQSFHRLQLAAIREAFGLESQEPPGHKGREGKKA